MSWWPYGEMAEDLARAVLEGHAEMSRRLAEAVIVESDKIHKFKIIESDLCKSIDACEWDKCDDLIDEMRKLHIMDTPEIVRYETTVHFERGTTVLDRIVEQVDHERFDHD